MTLREIKPEGKCGDCQSFDTNNCEKKPIGTTTLKDGSVVNNGLCRASDGLILGLLNEKTDCRQPSSTFKPLEKIG